MAGLFDDVFNSLTGQQAIPQANIMDTNQLLSQSYDAMNANLPALNSYNQNLALGNANAQLGYEKAVNPYANDVRTGAYKSVLDNLNLGTSLSPELEADITRKLFETGAATGFGYSPASRGNIALQTGLQQQALGRQRQQDALQAANGLALTGAGYSPQGGLDVGGVAGLFQQEQASRDNLANVQEQMRQDNFSSLLNTGTRILGGIAGGFFGGPMGAIAGASAGNSVFGRAPNRFGGGGTGLLSTFGNTFSQSGGPTPAGPSYFTDASAGMLA